MSNLKEIADTISTHHDSMDLERYIEFSLGPENYALPLLMVREVISAPDTTPIPQAPNYFLGIMNLRGKVISIIDLRKKLKTKPKEENLDEAVIILALKGMNLGIMVDSINTVLAFSQNDICDTPEIESQVNSKFIKGVFRKDRSLTVLIDVLKVLDIDDLKAIQSQEVEAKKVA